MALMDWFDAAPIQQAVAFVIALLMGGSAFILWCALKMAGRNHDPNH